MLFRSFSVCTDDTSSMKAPVMVPVRYVCLVVYRMEHHGGTVNTSRVAGGYLHGPNSSVSEKQPLVHLAAFVPVGWVELACLLCQVHHHCTTLEDSKVIVVVVHCTATSIALSASENIKQESSYPRGQWAGVCSQEQGQGKPRRAAPAVLQSTRLRTLVCIHHAHIK